MKIIILGSGDVSLELAKYLVDAGHAVTIADTASEKLAEIANRIDLRVVVGNPASPETLRKAGAKNTELLVATTSDDETNITACSVAHFLFKTTRTIARQIHGKASTERARLHHEAAAKLLLPHPSFSS